MWTHLIHGEDCHVDDARNSILREFLRSDAGVLFFLDADIGWNTESFLKLLRSTREVIGGAYRKKGDEVEFAVRLDFGVQQAEADGALRVRGLPAGFLAIKRQVIELMVEANAHRRFRGQRERVGDPLHTIVFERTYEKGERFSGDYSFCRAWQRMGGQVYVDPEMVFVHEGTKEFVGCLGDTLRSMNGVEHPGLRSAFAELRAGNASDLVFETLFGAWGNDFAASTELLLAAHLLAQEGKGPILECGSGVSTLVLAASGREVHTLEHDPEYLQRTRRVLDMLAIDNVNLHYAPLREYADFWWYEVPPMPASFGMVFCDGPQGRYGRDGLFRLLSPRISSALVLADDAERAIELSGLQSWAGRNGRRVEILGEKRPFAVVRPPVGTMGEGESEVAVG